MKKFADIATIMTLVIILAVAINTVAHAEVEIPDGLYPHFGVITEMTEYMSFDGTIIWSVTVTDCEDRSWVYLDDADDLCIGDMMSLLMLDEYNTPNNVYDDLVVDARYVGVLSFYSDMQ